MITLDFTKIHEFHDFGVAVLAQALKHRVGPRVGLKGLQGKEIRMLREFGVSYRHIQTSGTSPSAASTSKRTRLLRPVARSANPYA